jgi:serine phosphatase RsbU (regulator of sigma subunit)
MPYLRLVGNTEETCKIIKLILKRNCISSLFSLCIFTLLLLLSHLNLFAQKQGQARIDSIVSYLQNNNKQDTNTVNSLCEIAFAYYTINPEKGVEVGKEALKLAEKLNFIGGQAKANRFIGVNYYGLSDYKGAIEFYKKALQAETKNGNKKGMGSNLMNIGLIYTSQSDYGKALDYYFKSLRLFEQIKFEKGLSTCYGNILLVYMEIDDYDKALQFAFKALEIDKAMGNEIGQARHLGNIGVLYTHKKELEKARKYLNEALELYMKVDDQRGVANIIGNIAGSYIKKKEFDTAINYIQQSIAGYERLNSKKDVAANTLNLSSAYIEMYKSNYNSKLQGKSKNKLDFARENTLKALAISQELNETFLERDARYQLYEIEKLKGNKSGALAEYEKYIALRDTINGQENKKDILRKELLFEFEKKAAEDSIKNLAEKQLQQAQIEAQQANLKVEKTKRNGLIVGIVVLLIGALFIANRLRVTRRQKEFIERQKDFVEHQRSNISAQKKILEEKNKEIFDSILYAKRLQEAILPSNKLLNKYLPNSFVFYKPKDIVAGDFYWMDTFAKDDFGNFLKPLDADIDPSECILFAVADCTGHGVPGAMISIFCSNALNRAIKEFYLLDPGNILDKVRSLVIETFEKSDMEVRDGMDISLCVFNFKSYELFWAGANNPLWLVRNQEMIEYKPDRQPIGKFDNPTNFKTHKIQLQKGDKFYIFSDGLADQFGGQKGKKLKTGKMRELIMAQQSNSMQMQYDIMDKFFDLWKGSLEQVDDICVIGVSV